MTPPSIQFLGVGEACDHRHGNTSVLLDSESGQLLCDCGFTVPHRLFAQLTDPERLDGVWISHFHGDHFFGTPLLLLRLWDMGRTKELTFIGQPGIRHVIEQALNLVYPGFAQRLTYPLRFVVSEDQHPISFCGLTLEALKTEHGQRNQGLLITVQGRKIYYSGDGRPTTQLHSRLRHADLIIHESFRLSEDIHNHSSISGCLELATATQAKRFALTHLERSTRLLQATQIKTLLADYPTVFLPQEGELILLD
jgi:ribonuclease Z